MAPKKTKPETKPKNNTVKTLSLGVRFEHDIIARLDELARRIGAAATGPVKQAPTRSDMIKNAVLDYLTTWEAKYGATAPALVAPLDGQSEHGARVVAAAKAAAQAEPKTSKAKRTQGALVGRSLLHPKAKGGE